MLNYGTKDSEQKTQRRIYREYNKKNTTAAAAPHIECVQKRKMKRQMHYENGALKQSHGK